MNLCDKKGEKIDEVVDTVLNIYKEHRKDERPKLVPSRVRVIKEVFGDEPFRGAGIAPGDYQCESNQYGAVSVQDRAGKMLGLRPNDYQTLEWRLP